MNDTRNHSLSKWTLTVFSLTLLCAVTAFAQDKDKDTKSAPGGNSDFANLSLAVDSARKAYDLPAPAGHEGNGETVGGLQVNQGAEFGGRISDFSGNPGMWDTFVNLGTGPRLLEYTLDMRSPSHTGLLFDDLSLSNFGYGGDPYNVSRLRFSKGAVYDFNANFRRDQNIFDYDLFANPLNPFASTPSIQIQQSPHEFLLTRRMSDVNLSLFPVSVIRVKMGWSRVVNEGTTFSTVHEGTEGLLSQPTLNTSDSFNFGVSFRFIPKTNINYDQFYTYYKGDTTAQLASPDQLALFGFPSFTLAGGTPVNLGLPFNTAAGQPCATPVLGTGLANPACNGFFGYSRSGRNRNSYPTEQISFQSNYFNNVDFSGRFSYSGAEASTPDYSEAFDGLTTRNRARQFSFAGSALAKRISVSADFGITFRLSEKARLIDNFRLNNFRIPTSWDYTTNTAFGATLLSSPNLFTPAACPPPFTAATCPQHNASSGADVIRDLTNQFIRQDSKINTIELEYDFTRHFTAYLGYRYERREITVNDSTVQFLTFFPGPTAALANRGACAGQPVNAQGVCTTTTTDDGSDFTEINGHAALFGLSFRPSPKFRASFDTEQFYADNTFTRISPRHQQWYKGRINYQAREWWNVGAVVNIRENRNDAADINNLQHNRSYVFTGSVAPAEARWGLDLSYDYNDIFSQTNICFVATPTPAGSISCGTPFLSGISTYKEASHLGSGMIVLKPVNRVTAGIGYTVTSSTGSTLILNPIAPTGPLSFNYHLPTASLAVKINDRLTYKTGWNYYDYNEKSDPGPTLPRDFRGNAVTLSLRYSM